ncbi:SLBB domain-containing protein [Shewanella amazonensis]|uniref:ClpX, ATPase regulatory subunit n=1 Tax=Shewanella amazonensis (strain ATCC BAA-1098 / SB2B) TaxID=326297 RepID=A1S7W3_SHEAM|nr:SLBB domain-containing protein [Shewanella amazonensis]ABM00470.1 ClpX, ATPase regulatory subunit [Shewanella amazonensis SB2B]
MLQQLKRFLIAGVGALVLVGGPVAAITPSPQMIEQFKNLPKAEQERIARQYGIDPSMLSGQATQPTIVNPEVVAPRNTGSTTEVVNQSETDAFNQATKTESQIEAREEELEKQLKRFGYDMFAGEPSTFAPVSDVPVPAEYMMGPGDVLNVQLYGKENKNFSLTVGRDGLVQFPDLGPISLVGMSFSEAKNFLTDKIAQSMIGIQANITMGELRSIRIFVAGDAYRPGSYTVSSLSTITQALFVSGGINEIGSLRNIQLKRAGRTVGTFDLYDLLLAGDASKDLRLQSGDVVFIPSVGGLVSVTGEVRRPAIYEIKANDTMADVLNMASGAKPGAYPEASTIERFSKDVKTVINVDLTQASGLSVKAKAGDLVRVKSTSTRIDNAVTLVGAVVRPGKYQYRNGMRLRDMLPSIWGDLTLNADLDYGLLVREINQRGDVKVIQVSVGKAISGDDSANIALQPRDTLMVFDYADRATLLEPVITQLRQQSRFGDAIKLADINGSVRFPGKYPITEGATIKDLLVAAGGLKEGAYTLSAELTRQNISEQTGVTVTHQQLSLQDVLLNDPSANIALQSRDVLTVRDLPDWQDTRWVTIKGEVRFPGTYSIQRGETLKHVLSRAGGLSEDAAPRSAVFLRESVKQKEKTELLKLSDELRREIAAKALTKDTPTVGYADAQNMLKELENVEVLGRLVVDINAIQLGIDEADLKLEDGDALFIPAQNQTVSVMGQVQHPSTHRYKKGFTFDQYLELAGGPRKRADDDRAYILRADGSVAMPGSSYWFSTDEEMQPGDTIVMPLDTEYKDNLTLWSQVTQIIYNTAVAVATISGL